MLKWIIRRLIYPIVLIGLLIYWLTTSVSGLKTTRTLVQYLFPHITMSDIQGHLFSQFVIKDLSYQGNSILFSSSDIAVTWKSKRLFKSQFFIPKIQITNARVMPVVFVGPPIHIKNLEGSIDLTPTTKKLNIVSLSGHWDKEFLQGTMALHIYRKQLQRSHAEFTFGSKSFVFSPDSKNTLLHHWRILSRTVSNNATPIQLIAGTLHQTPDALRVNTEGGHLPLTLFNALLPSSLHFQSGILYLEGRLEKAENQPFFINSTFKITPGQLRLNVPTLPTKVLAFKGGKISIAHDAPQHLHIAIDAVANADNQLKGQVEAKSIKFDPTPAMLNGQIQAKMGDLSLLQHFFPDLAKLNATLTTDIQVGGDIASPTMTLHAHSKDASFQLPRQGLHIKNVALDIQGNQKGQYVLKGSGTSDPGNFNVSGEFDLFEPNAKNTITLTGKNLEVYHTSTYHVIISPNLKIYKGEDNQLHMEGNIHVPMAYVNLQHNGVQTVYSQDVRFIDEESAVSATPFIIMPDVEIQLEDGYFQGYGFYQSVFSGKIHIKRRPDSYLTGDGRLSIRSGKYRLQRRTLYIHQGRLLYPSGTLLNDPLLDIRMSQQIPAQSANNEVGLYLQGTLQRPIVHPYSNTGLKESEILSQLGLGGPNAQFLGLSQAANILTTSGGESLLDQLQSRLGIEEIDIESQQSNVTKKLSAEDENDTYLVIGKSLSKDFYVQYLQGMFKETSTIRLKYFLSSKIALSVETGTLGTGADILFATERD